MYRLWTSPHCFHSGDLKQRTFHLLHVSLEPLLSTLVMPPLFHGSPFYTDINPALWSPLLPELKVEQQCPPIPRSYLLHRIARWNKAAAFSPRTMCKRVFLSAESSKAPEEMPRTNVVDWLLSVLEPITSADNTGMERCCYSNHER